MISSVSADDDAIAEPQPKVWKRASVMIWVSGSTLIDSRKASPQAIAPTSPTPSAPSSAPTFFGLKK